MARFASKMRLGHDRRETIQKNYVFQRDRYARKATGIPGSAEAAENGFLLKSIEEIPEASSQAYAGRNRMDLFERLSYSVCA
ncbi:hypothetical protein ACOBR2_05225 [Telmatobacter bradus]|uniref:hypothetical protein n=1 Tax=Telmatobacter bradus TaxID=474953 RepID=UPI003B431812